jgi:acyl carrier protein
MSDSRDALQGIFREVFDDPTIELRDEMTAADIEGWDSVSHIDLLIAVERSLEIKFATAEMSRLNRLFRATDREQASKGLNHVDRNSLGQPPRQGLAKARTDFACASGNSQRGRRPVRDDAVHWAAL